MLLYDGSLFEGLLVLDHLSDKRRRAESHFHVIHAQSSLDVRPSNGKVPLLFFLVQLFFVLLQWMLYDFMSHFMNGTQVLVVSLKKVLVVLSLDLPHKLCFKLLLILSFPLDAFDLENRFVFSSSPCLRFRRSGLAREWCWRGALVLKDECF